MPKNDPYWGGQGKPRGDGVHFTLWRRDDSKGKRLSWDQDGDKIKNLHHTDQNSDEHSNDPKSWRK